MSRVTVDQSSWGHVVVTGSDRVRFLNGMVTGNIETLESGQWIRTMILSHKARVLAILEVNAYDDHLLLSCEPSLTKKIMAWLKY